MPLTETEVGFYAKTLQEDIKKRVEGFLEEENSTSKTMGDVEGILRSVLEEAHSKGIIEDFSNNRVDI